MRCSRRSSGLLSKTLGPSARDEAGEFSSTRALQRLLPVAAGSRTHGQRHQAGIRIGYGGSHERWQ